MRSLDVELIADRRDMPSGMIVCEHAPPIYGAQPTTVRLVNGPVQNVHISHWLNVQHSAQHTEPSAAIAIERE